MFNYEKKIAQTLLICSMIANAGGSKEMPAVNEVLLDLPYENKSRNTRFNVGRRARQDDDENDEDDDDSPGLIQKIQTGFKKAMSNAWNGTMTSVFGKLYSKKPDKDSESGFLDKMIQSPWFQPIFNQVVTRLAGTDIEELSKLNGRTRSPNNATKTAVEDNESIDDIEEDRED